MWTALLSLATGGWGLILKGFGLAKKIPWQVWAVIAAALALWGIYHWHMVKVHEADRAGYSRRIGEEKTARAHALVAKVNIEGTGNQIAGALKEEHDAKISSVGAAGADIVRYGPGEARCGRFNAPAAPALPGGQVAASGPGDPAVAAMPDQGGAAVLALPFDDAVRLFGQCDINRDEAAKARLNDDRQRAAWEAYRKALATAPK